MWTIKSEGTTSRNEVITMLNAQFSQILDNIEIKMKMQEVFYNQTQQQLLVLCDGMGGHKAGKLQVSLLLMNFKNVLKMRIL